MSAVLYAAKSTEDRRASIPHQLAACREWCEREGYSVVGEYRDEGFSAYSGNRGAGLAAAREHAARVARESGTVAMLVCRHSDRISRGAGDRPGASEALVEIWHASRRANVHLRSTTASDDRDLETSAGTASIGERNRADSERKSESVRDGYDRARHAGKALFGITPDGYVMERWYDSGGEAQRRMVQDPDRKALWELVWRLAGEGWSDRAIVLELDRHGWLTAPRKSGQAPRPFDANRIRQSLTNPIYAGLQVGRVHADDCDSSTKPCCAHRTEVLGAGEWEGYVTPEDFHRIKAMRRDRSNGASGQGGRPPIGYLLGGGLARCPDCGGAMDCVTGRWERKDGSRPRRYVCRTHRERPQDCAVLPVDAAVADGIVLAGIEALIVDADALRGQLLAGRRAEHDRLGQMAARAREDAAAAEGAAERAESRYADALANGDDDAVCEVLLRAAAAKRREAQQAMTVADGALDALSDDEPDNDSAVQARLWEVLSGRVKDADGDVRRLNAALREDFDGFELRVEAGAVSVVPVLSVDAIQRALRDPASSPFPVRALDSTAFVVDEVPVLTGAPETAPSPWRTTGFRLPAFAAVA